ncbi:MAG: HdeD family acid-resistance protein [Eubacterium sp.]
MREFFVKLKNLSIITIVAGISIGIILLIKPDEAVKLVSILCGATVILLGAGAWISYFTKWKSTLLALLGTLAIIAGIILCVKYESIISVVLFLFGIFVLVSGVVDFVSAIDARRNDLKSWIVSLIMSIATIILGIIVVVNPFDSMLVLTRLLGISLIVYAIMDLISFIQIKKIIKYSVAPQIAVDAQEHTED